jgi:glutaredoxin 2
MTDGLLTNIIQLEKSIQGDIAAELTRAQRWEKRELALLERERTQARKAFAKKQEERMRSEKSQLESEAQTLLRRSKQLCHHLEHIKEDILIQELKKHLQTIVFGGDDDHPHGQS